MNYNLATLWAASGKTLMLPGWLGYFTWDYAHNELVFKNGDYFLNNKLLRDKGITNREDWYWII